MSLQSLLTLGVAGGIWVAGAFLYLVIRGARALVRRVTGRPRRPIEEFPAEDERSPVVIGRGPTLGDRARRGLKRVGDGAGALIVFLVATLTSVTARISNALWSLASKWWREAAQPSLVEARDMGIARMTSRPEDSGQLEVLLQVSPVLLDEVLIESEEEAEQEMQLV